MGALLDALAPDTPATVTPEILDSLKKVESGGNPYAVNPSTGAMGPYQFMPSTVAMLHKQGMKFNPFDEKEARGAAENYLNTLIQQNGGDIKKALAQYGGFRTKDPTSYVEKILTPSTETPSAAPGGLVEAMVGTEEPALAAPAKPAPVAPAQAVPAERVKPPSFASAMGGSAEPVLQMATGAAGAIAGGYKGLFTLLKTGDPKLARNAVNETISNWTYQPRTEAGQAISAGLGKVGEGIEYVLDAAGNLVSNPGGGPLNVKNRALYPNDQNIRSAFGALAKGGIAVAPMISALGTPTRAVIAKEVPKVAPEPTPLATPIEQTLQPPKEGTPAAAVERTPEAVTGSATQVAKVLPLETQQARSSVLGRLGINKVWRSALTGDVLEGATNAQLARFPEPAGQAARAQFVAEKRALETHADKIIENTGGTSGLDETTVHARGQTIAAPFDALRDYFDTARQKLYAAADKASEGKPMVSMEPIETQLADQEFNNTALGANQQHLVQAAKNQLDLLKKNNPQGITVSTAEEYRKWLNRLWTPDNKHFIETIKDSVDEAVTRSAGEDVYAAARQMHQLRQQTLENPKGVARLMDTDPKSALNRVTPFEKIPETITRLDVDQFRNIISTLDNMPAELQPLAQRAKSEIKAHFINKIKQAGIPNTKTESPFWNNRAVNDVLKANSAKLSSLLTPKEASMLSDLRAGGNILAVQADYPGAAAQASQAVRQGLMSHIIPNMMTSAGASAGAFFGGPVGAATGGMGGRAIGQKWSAATTEKNALKRVGKRMIPLSEVR
jgi:hypothetical protein